MGYERVQELLGVESRIRDRPGAREAPRFTGLVELDRALPLRVLEADVAGQ